MNPEHRARLAARIAEVAGHALAARQVVTPIEVLTGIGWLPAAQVESWRRGRVPYLERVAGANLAKLSGALRLLADWAQRHGLTPSETVYVAWTRDRHRLRFTKTGDANVERAWRTHWIAPTLTEAKHARSIQQHDAVRARRPGTQEQPQGHAAQGEAPFTPVCTANQLYVRPTHTAQYAADVSISSWRDRAGHPRSKPLASGFTMPLFPRSATLKVEKAWLSENSRRCRSRTNCCPRSTRVRNSAPWPGCRRRSRTRPALPRL